MGEFPRGTAGAVGNAYPCRLERDQLRNGNKELVRRSQIFRREKFKTEGNFIVLKYFSYVHEV